MSTKSFALLFSAWTVAVVAMLGSLFFSQVMEFVPCELCWYQRIAMYVLILITGGSGHYRSVFSYSISFAVIGWLIAVYHNLLHYEVIPETASPCMEGVSCSTVYIEWGGFITIPILSLTSFSIIITLLLLLKRNIENEK
jgi:disulfide bond formation protein DsbB